MFNTQLINTVLDWERRLEIEGETHNAHPNEPYVNNLAKVQPTRKAERTPLLTRLFSIGRKPQPTYRFKQLQEYPNKA